MTPESVGVEQDQSLVMGKHSGRAAFKSKLRELGYELGDNAIEDAFKRFKDLADRKKTVYDEDLIALVDDEIGSAHERISLVAMTVIAGTMGQSATITLAIEGQHTTTQATGNGPVDAIFNAIHHLVPHEARLDLYQVHAVTEGTDAQAEVSVRLAHENRSVTAKGADPDTLVATARAYIAALNKLLTLAGGARGARPRPAEKKPGAAVLRGARGRTRVDSPPRLCYTAHLRCTAARRDGRIAQLVEQLTLNQRVVGSSPTAPTITF